MPASSSLSLGAQKKRRAMPALLIVGEKQIPFVVSLSNHALRANSEWL
jgi:hypothetical protein